MKCGHCGATNSDSARFCAKCAFRLPATAGNLPEAQSPNHIAAPVTVPPPVVPAPDDADATIIMLPQNTSLPEPVSAASAVPPAVAAPEPRAMPETVPAAPRKPREPDPVKPAAAAAAASTASIPGSARKSTGSKLPVILGGMAALVLAAVAVWWISRGALPKPMVPLPVAAKPAPPTVAVAPPAPPAAVVPPPPISAEPAAAAGSPLAALETAAPAPAGMTTELPLPVAKEATAVAPGEITPVQKAALLAKAEKQKARRDADLKRKAELELRRKQDEEGRVQAADAARARDAEARSRQDEQARQARAAAAASHRSPQQTCADRPNFISRGLCESRECEKPEHANAAFCVQMRERRAPKDVNN